MWIPPEVWGPIWSQYHRSMWVQAFAHLFHFFNHFFSAFFPLFFRFFSSFFHAKCESPRVMRTHMIPIPQEQVGSSLCPPFSLFHHFFFAFFLFFLLFFPFSFVSMWITLRYGGPHDFNATAGASNGEFKPFVTFFRFFWLLFISLFYVLFYV